MKYFGKYLTYRLKKSIIRCLVLSIISLVLIAAETTNLSSDGLFGWTMNHGTGNYNSRFIYVALIATIALAPIAVAVMEFWELKNRKNADTIYFLPMSRYCLGLSFYFSGLIQTIFITTVAYFTQIIRMCTSNAKECYHYEKTFIIYLIIILSVICVYTIVSFLFYQANTGFDGYVFCSVWKWAIPAVILMICVIFDITLNLEFALKFAYPIISFAPITLLKNGFGYNFKPKTNIGEYAFTDRDGVKYYKSAMEWDGKIFEFFSFSYIIIILAVLAVIGLIISFKFKRVEKIGDISDSWFGYKTLIPTLSILASGALLRVGGNFVFLCAVVAVATAVSIIVYRRGFKFKIFDLILMGAEFALVFLSALI